MITGKEYLKKHIGETNIPEEYYENEIGEMMDWYADYYHQTKLKLLGIGDVINCPLCGGEMAFVHPENCMTEGCPNCIF